MIYLLTGTPGHGKTQRALWMLLNDKRFKGRTVYHANVRGLKVDDPRLENWKPLDDVTKWQELPAGSIIFIDECHKDGLFPLRSSMQKPPKWIEAIAEHRHLGLDFVLVTQNAKKIDVEIRRLVELHIHCKRPAQMPFTNVYEFQGVVDVDGTIPATHLRHERWRLDKNIWSLYESSDEHTAKARIPRVLFVLPALIIVGALCVSFAYNWLGNLGKGKAPDEQAKTTDVKANSLPGTPQADVDAAVAALNRFREANAAKKEFLDSMKPLAAAYPESASIYDDIRVAKSLPRMTGCVRMRDVCRCYTQQGTYIHDVELAACVDFLTHGRFDPYRDESRRDQLAQQQPHPATAATAPAPRPYLVQGLSGHWFTETREQGYSVTAGGDFINSQRMSVTERPAKQGGAGGTPVEASTPKP